MPAAHRTDLARDVFKAFPAGDRERIESLLAPGLRFLAPPEPDLDRAGYFERCWPGSGNETAFDFARIIEAAAAPGRSFGGISTAGPCKDCVGARRRVEGTRAFRRVPH